MTAAILREAAALMRSRAEAATPNEWRANGTVVMAHSVVPFGVKYVADCFDEPQGSEADAAHIASWDPAVALAVADWLDHLAQDEDHVIRFMHGHALAVARAYLATP